MSIYATQWILQFPAFGDAHSRCEWVAIIAQGVPAHVGTPTGGYGYEAGDPYSGFLPPAVPVTDDDESSLRAVVIVRDTTEKIGQEYIGPLLVLSGAEYSALSFQTLYDRICDALRGARPRVLAEVFGPDGEARLLFENDRSEPDTRSGSGRS